MTKISDNLKAAIAKWLAKKTNSTSPEGLVLDLQDYLDDIINGDERGLGREAMDAYFCGGVDADRSGNDAYYTEDGWTLVTNNAQDRLVYTGDWAEDEIIEQA